MGLWGTKTNNEKKPTWLNAEEKQNCYATKSGWVLKHKNGIEEVIVAVKGLATKIGSASVTDIIWGTGAYTAGATKQIKLVFNEKVNVTGNPTVAITKSTGGTVTATFTAINADKTTLTFEFVAPVAATTLTVATQSVLLAGGTILEVIAPNAAADLVITAPVGAAAKSKVTV